MEGHRNDPALKSTGQSSKVPEFDSQHLMWLKTTYNFTYYGKIHYSLLPPGAPNSHGANTDVEEKYPYILKQ